VAMFLGKCVGVFFTGENLHGRKPPIEGGRVFGNIF